MSINSEVDILAFLPEGSPCGWQIVLWSFIENLSGVHNSSSVLIQTIDRSETWLFHDMGEAFKFCFDTGKVPVDESGYWDDSGDLMFGDSEAVPIVAWRRLWNKEVKGSSDSPVYEYQSPDWPIV